jgi:RNA polymerase sigma-70 factor (ECF subfamily)
MRLNAEQVDGDALEAEGRCSEENGPDHRVDPLVEALYRSQGKRLFGLFVRKVGFQDAGDLVQETFARFAGARTERNIVPDAPERYLVRIASNLLRDRAKSSEQRVLASTIPAEDAGLVAADQIRTLEARDMLSHVEAVIMQLKPKTRSIFIAAHFHGLSRAEIAAQTGLSVKGVEKHMTKAYGHLQRCLGDL